MPDRTVLVLFLYLSVQILGQEYVGEAEGEWVFMDTEDHHHDHYNIGLEMGIAPEERDVRVVLGHGSPETSIEPKDLKNPSWLEPFYDQEYYTSESPLACNVPRYGKYCGAGFGSGEPIDSIDQVCKEHDICYKANGLYDCECDRELFAKLNNLIQEKTCGGRIDGAMIMAHYAATQCFCRKLVPCGESCKTCIKHGMPYPCHCVHIDCDVRVPVANNMNC